MVQWLKITDSGTREPKFKPWLQTLEPDSLSSNPDFATYYVTLTSLLLQYLAYTVYC